jgi:aspartate/methionine/tyrosine aminotransferase
MHACAWQGIKVDPDHIALLAGAGAVLDTLFWCICSKGSGVLLPKPIYPAFINDMEVGSWLPMEGRIYLSI